MTAAIRAIEFHLPERAVTNHDLCSEFPDWTVDKIESKTGIRCRWIASEHETSADLAFEAAHRLLANGPCHRSAVDFLLFCTQSPDYFLPTTACILQDRLGLPSTCGALDFNLGCSGYVYGLSLAKGLIETGQARNVLLLTAETYSKFIHPTDRSVRTIFGDGAAATLVSAVESGLEPAQSHIGPFVFGTDGSGAENLMVAAGGMRKRISPAGRVAVQEGPSDENLHMNGPEIFSFTLDVVPKVVRELLSRAGKTVADVDFYIFHQANEYLLEHLRKRIAIPKDKFYIGMHSLGNTVSSTIPIGLKEAAHAGQIHSGDLIMLVGFGVGYSWSATLIRWC